MSAYVGFSLLQVVKYRNGQVLRFADRKRMGYAAKAGTNTPILLVMIWTN